MAKRKQADHRAETRGQGMSGLPHVVSDAPAYLLLTPFERAVHAEILKRFNGYNNGMIAITYEEIGERLKGRNAWPPNNARIAKAVVTLMEHGLIAEPTLQSWLQRRSRTYRLTYISSGKAPPFKPATNEYRVWKPPTEKKNGDAASPRKPRTGDAASLGVNDGGDDRSPTVLKNGSFASAQLKSPGDVKSSLICIPYPPRGDGEQAASSNLVTGPWSSGPCEHCGEPFRSGNRGKPNRFCSEQCRKRAEARRQLSDHRPKRGCRRHRPAPRPAPGRARAHRSAASPAARLRCAPPRSPPRPIGREAPPRPAQRARHPARR